MSGLVPYGLPVRGDSCNFISRDSGLGERSDRRVGEPLTQIEAKAAVVRRRSFDERASESIVLLSRVTVLRESNELCIYAAVTISEANDGRRNSVE
jgi:hypothetical protein